ncbi:hypothetical protein [Dapis sp. BLCC M229]|uniref:hypothetical protein n=1 Tax=Dapis sp. BLCC M229 TaxID=3400188 RepID=UPI003CFB5B76
MKSTQINQPGLILTPSTEGWWDSERISSPRVLHDLDGTWKMWYYGRDASFDRQINLPTGRCGLAISSDGIEWERVKGPLTMGAIFEPHPDENRFDSAHVGVSDVYFSDGLYWMWYLGGDRQVLEIGKFQAKGIQMLPGCAVSRDGINWVRLEGPHRGAFLSPGQPGEFDALFCAWPQVLKDGSSWKMYYHTLNPERLFLVGLAVSQNGFQWEKVGQILGPGEPGSFDERGIGTRHVLKIDGQYLMFYEGVNQTGYHSIGLAISADGINWEKQPGSEVGGSIFSHAPKGSGRWDARAIGTPCVVPMADGSFRMYYIGANEGGHDELSSQHQIGLAVSDGSNFRKWYRWGE